MNWGFVFFAAPPGTFGLKISTLPKSSMGVLGQPQVGILSMAKNGAIPYHGLKLGEH